MEEFISQYFQQFSFSELVNYSFGIFGSIGVVITIVAYYHSRRGQKPKYMVKTSSFQSKMIENSSFEIRQADKVINDFAISKLAVWNAGTTIKHEDIATKDPLHLTANGDVEILEVQLLFSEKQNDVKYQLSEDRKSIIMSFEFLAHNEGFVMKVFHTGTTAKSLSIGCSLISGRHLTKSEWILLEQARKISSRISFRKLAKLYGWMIILLCFVSASEALFGEKIVLPVQGKGLFATLIQVFLYLILAIYAYRTLISPRLPKKLDRVFNSDY